MAATVYMIRHGEKPIPNGIGLSEAGKWRAQQILEVFGKGSDYNIGYILAEKPDDDGTDARPFLTVKPLADSLSLDVDERFKNKPEKYPEVAEAVKAFQGPGNILICWEHHALTDIATAIGVQDAPEYDGDHFDYLWTLNDARDAIVQTTYSIPPYQADGQL